jgi:hypothetical protein
MQYARERESSMKPLVVRPKQDREKSPGKEQGKTGKSGEGASSALEHLIHQERSRVLHNHQPPPDKAPS